MKKLVPRIRTKKLFISIFLGYLFSAGVLSLIIAFLSLFHIVPVYLNDTEYMGIQGFLIGLIYIPLITVCCTLSTGLFIIFGLWIAKGIFGEEGES